MGLAATAALLAAVVFVLIALDGFPEGGLVLAARAWAARGRA